MSIIRVKRSFKVQKHEGLYVNTKDFIYNTYKIINML